MILRRTYPRPPADVFRAWTEPQALTAWFGGVLGRTLSAAVDLRVGGAYRLTMAGDGGIGTVGGVYREVVRPDRLVFTWAWEGLGGESLVTVEFHDRDGATEVVLRHEGLGTDGERAFHRDGWAASLEALAGTLVAA